MFSWTSLPTEVLTECMFYLETIELVRCRLLCKTFKTIVDTSLPLKYRLELHFDNSVDMGYAGGSTSDRYKRLIACRDSWARLEWAKFTSVASRGDCSAYEAVGGKFVKMLWGCEFSVLDLPTSTSEPHLELRPDLPGMIKDFAMDPSQDIIAYLEDDATLPSYDQARELKMHIKSLSTLKDHPDASCPVLPFTILVDELWSNVLGIVTIQLVEDVLALFIRYPLKPSRLLMWNWKSGKLVTDDDRGSIVSEAVHFGFIDTETFVLPTADRFGAIHVSRIIDGRVVSLAALALPELALGIKVDSIASHTSALPSNPTGICPNQDKRIQTFAITYATELDQQLPATHCLFVHNEYLLEQARIGAALYEGIWDPLKTKPKLHWKRWGPENTRFIHLDGVFHWMRYVCGQKVVCPASRKAPEEIQIFDFNLHPTRVLPDTIVRRAVVGESSVQKGLIFRSHVRSSLPYYVLTREMPHAYSGFMIDEHSIVGLKSLNGPEGLELDTIDTFCFPVS